MIAGGNGWEWVAEGLFGSSWFVLVLELLWRLVVLGCSKVWTY